MGRIGRRMKRFVFHHYSVDGEEGEQSGLQVHNAGDCIVHYDVLLWSD